MGLISEFKEFAVKGNFVDLAVGVILGAASGDVVKAIVDKIVMPPIGLLLGKVNFADLKLVLQEGMRGPDGKTDVVKEVAIGYGAMLQSLVSFFIIAVVVFLVVRSLQRFKSAAPPPEVPAQEKLLAEIRDALLKSAVQSPPKA